MFEIDKRKFGEFVSALRKEKGLTQKQLAEKLYISNKAISKWETGTTIPDTGMLIPLAEVLGVTVTELLKGEKLDNIDNNADDTVKTAIIYRAYQDNNSSKTIFIMSILFQLVLLCILFQLSRISVSIIVNAILTTVFGIYFYYLVQLKLPDYYDHNNISSVHDGFFRMNIPGVHFNNRNWPRIVKAERIVMIFNMLMLPLLSVIFGSTAIWIKTEVIIMQLMFIGGIFAAVIFNR